jgi:hypothetical protein
MIGPFIGDVGDFYGEESKMAKRYCAGFAGRDRTPTTRPSPLITAKTWETKWIMTFKRP